MSKALAYLVTIAAILLLAAIALGNDSPSDDLGRSEPATTLM
jgi:hypothetical protein